MASAESFSKRGEMLSSPLALSAFSCLMVLRTNVSLIFSNLKLGRDRLVSCQVRCLFVESTILIVCLMRVTAMVKNSLKVFAILFSSLQRSPLISIVLEEVDYFSPGSVFLVILNKLLVIGLFSLLESIVYPILHRFICKPVFVERCFSRLL